MKRFKSKSEAGAQQTGPEALALCETVAKGGRESGSGRGYLSAASAAA